MSKVKYYIEIVDYDTEETVERMGPMTEHKAGKVDDGVNINLNHEKYFTRIVKEGEEDGE